MENVTNNGMSSATIESNNYEFREKKKIYNITDRVINVDTKHDIHVSESIREGDKESMVDIRLYSMFVIDGIYDNKKKATNRGIHFGFKFLPQIIAHLISIYEVHEGTKFDYEKFARFIDQEIK